MLKYSMVFYQIAGFVFSIINIILLFNAAPKVKGNEQTLAEEYQNITLTNKIIEKLLQNYEILKSMYKSRESVHSSSSFEVNKTYKTTQGVETTKHRSRSFKKNINYSETTLRPGTAIIYGSASSSHEKKSSSEEKPEVKSPTQKKNISKNFNQQRVKFENILENNKKVESEVIESNESESNDGIEELPLEMPTTKNTFNKQKQNVNTMKQHKKYQSKHNDLGEKTRFDVLKQVAHKKRKHKNLRTDNDPNARRIKKVVYSELFSPYNIWYEVINKPIKLNIDTDPFSEKQRAYEKQDAGEKLSVYILNTKESRANSTENKLKNNEIENLLRSTYGEACLRTPIKKCKKVVKAVTKNACKARFKCKSDFKSDFIEFGDKGCEKEFSFKKPNGKKQEEKKSNEEKIQPLLRKQDETKIDEYLGDEDNFKELSEKNRHDIIIDKSALRDKYERECQKQSKSKCIKACNYAVEKTCSKHTCENRKEKGLQKACKSECKNMFQVEKDSDESGSSETESESDTGSD